MRLLPTNSLKPTPAAPLRESEEPVVRPYWLVDDIELQLLGRTCSRLFQLAGCFRRRRLAWPLAPAFAIRKSLL